MRFIRTAGWDEGVAAFAERLKTELESGKKVLWLTSGGSNIRASVQIMNQLPAELTAKLTVMPSDERYGEPGHANSNWAQLLNEGFGAKQAKLLPVLKPGQSFESARQDYEAMVEQAFGDCDFSIAQLGIGEDGHILGILPDSPAVEASGLVSAYEGGGYQRLTMTFQAFGRTDIVYAFAFGEGKLNALTNLKDQALPLSEQPAQFLKQMAEAYVYNDQVDEA
jgi:6-phosphogluconolactonase/glucosamine-6-phosphate isomerase/deaminase